MLRFKLELIRYVRCTSLARVVRKYKRELQIATNITALGKHSISKPVAQKVSYSMIQQLTAKPSLGTYGVG